MQREEVGQGGDEGQMKGLGRGAEADHGDRDGHFEEVLRRGNCQVDEPRQREKLVMSKCRCVKL